MERLLGHDLRFSFEDFVAGQWPEARRRRFLLRPEIAEPASVDSLVWPSRFVFSGAFVARHPDGLPRIASEPENMLHRALDLWPEPSAMLDRFRRHGGAGAAILLKVTLLADRAAPDGDEWAPLLALAAEAGAGAGEDAPRLGFDVADGALTSGLANCGYADGEAAALRRAWVPALNRHGLFDRPDRARAFRDLSDRRVPEHAPFHVFGLYARPL